MHGDQPVDPDGSGSRRLTAREVLGCIALGAAWAALIASLGILYPRLSAAVGIPLILIETILTLKVLKPRLTTFVNELADETGPHVWLLVLLGFLVPAIIYFRL